MPTSLQMCAFYHLQQPVGDGLWRNVESALLQLFYGGQHRFQIFCLVVAVQCARRQGSTWQLVGKNNWCVGVCCLCDEYRRSFGLCFAHNYRHALFDDAGFFGGYLFDGVAQNVGMVEADVGDNRQRRRDDVGAIQPSAKADLDDGYIDLPLGEIEEREGGGYLEKRRLQCVDK